MYGDEWYERFICTVGVLYREKKNPLTVEEFEKAARIAAGMESFD